MIRGLVLLLLMFQWPFPGGHSANGGGGGGGPTLGVHATATGFSTSVTTTGIVTQASGSSFWVCTATPAAYATPGVTDSKGNTYTQIGTDVAGSGALAGLTFRRYYVLNGTGGSAHTFTATTTTSDSISIWAAEVKGATALDQQNAAQTSTSPFDSPTVTTTAANELLLGCAVDNSSGSGDTFTAGQSFTILDSITNGATSLTGASANRAVTSTGTYKSEFTSVQGTTMIVSIDTFK